MARLGRRRCLQKIPAAFVVLSLLSYLVENLGFAHAYEGDTEAAALSRIAPAPAVQRRALRLRTEPERDILGQALPGPVWGGKIFLLGVQIGSTYDSEEDAFVDVFAVAKEVISRFDGDTNTRCSETTFAATAYNLTKPLKDTMLSTEEISWLPLFCVVHGRGARRRRVPMERVPLRSHDGNQDDSTLIWRCDVSGVVPKKAWRSKPSETTIRVSIVAANWEILTTVDLPVNRGGAVGLYRTARTPQPLPAESSVTLCSSGVNKDSILYIQEFVAHHLAMGVGHIVLGLRAQPGSSLLNDVRRKLRPWLRTGAVSLVHTEVPYLTCDGGMMEALHFYHSCLFRAKGISEFAAIWGPQELWLPTAIDPAHVAVATLPKSLRAAAPAGCADWCYITFPSYSVHRPKEGYRSMRRFGTDFTMRTAEPTDTFKKAVSRTKTAHMGGLHVHGSCKSPLTLRQKVKYTIDGGAPACIPGGRATGAIHHMRTDSYEKVGGDGYVLDEYAYYYYERARVKLDEIQMLTQGS